MRAMKDKERLLLVIRVFLDLNGPATAKEIMEYVNNCPIKMQMNLHINTISSLLRGRRDIKLVEKTRKPKVYFIDKT